MNIGGKTFSGNGTSLDNKSCHFIIGFKDNVCQSYWKSSDGDNAYSNSLIKTVETNVYNALPVDIKAIFKKFSVVTGVSNSTAAGGSNTTTSQYFTSPAEKEILGSTSLSTTNEADALSQFTYYMTTTNRKHTNLNSRWWTRSPYALGTTSACEIEAGGGVSNKNVRNYCLGVSPFGCI